MSYITEFRIAGLAGRKSLYAAKLHRDVNIFFGLNGSGKTSLLKILHSAMDNDASILKAVPFTSAEVKMYSETYDRVFTRSFDKQSVPVQQTLELGDPGAITLSEWQRLSFHQSAPWQPIPTFIGAPGQFATGVFELRPRWETKKIENFREFDRASKIRWNHRYLPTTRLYLDVRGAVPRPSDISQQQTEEMLDRFFAQILSQLWLSYSAELLSEVRKTQETAITGILREVLASKQNIAKEMLEHVDLDRAYDRVANFLKRQTSPDMLGSKEQFAERYRAEPNLRSVVEEIDTVEREIENTMAPREKLQTLISTLFTGNKSVSFDDRDIRVETDDHTTIGLENLSSGEKHILKLFIEVLLTDKSSIMIDEPELSLHVDWQRRLVSDMSLLNSAAQYIFATHSPEIMADVHDSHIFSL